MAQGKIPPRFGAGEPSGLVARALPAAAYGRTGTDRLVLLAKPLQAGAGYVYKPLAVVPLQDLPEHLRCQVQVAAGAGWQGAGEAAVGTNADAPALLRGQLQPPHPVVPEGLRQLAGGPDGKGPTIEFAGGAHEYSQRRVLRLMADEGGKLVYLDASTLQSLSDTMKVAADTDLGKFYDDGLTAPENAADGDMPALENGVPIVALLVQLSDPGAFDYSTSPPEDAAPFTETLLGDGRAAELGAHYYDVVLPPPENLMPAVAGKASRRSLSHSYPVEVSPRAPAGQVSVDAGAKTGDPIAVVGVKGAATGAEAGRGHGGLSALVGVAAASSAATALAAGAAGPVMAFGLFAVLIGGLSLAMASISVV
ncbi:hypothetical protein U9M48_040599 [Paspalum notatum var. saurae]|uniref:Uncharacterized protein n=1 Tax=Paspalum notatum var. saurae TaxID=547442 RepID=A0AAQ3XDY1_PASNO